MTLLPGTPLRYVGLHPQTGRQACELVICLDAASWWYLGHGALVEFAEGYTMVVWLDDLSPLVADDGVTTP